jgi:hypothetical protein
MLCVKMDRPATLRKIFRGLYQLLHNVANRTNSYIITISNTCYNPPDYKFVLYKLILVTQKTE